MDVIEIPFVKHIGIKQDGQTLKLDASDTVKPHADYTRICTV